MAGISEGLLSLHEGLRDPNLGAGSEHSTKLIGPENHPKVSDFYHVDLKQLAEINMIEKYILGKDNIDSVSPFEVYKPKVDELVIWDLPDHQAPVARVPRKEEEEDLSAAEKENNRRMSTQEGGEVLSEEPAKPGSNPAPLVIPTQEGDRYAAEEGEKDSPEEETKGEATGSTNETQEKPPSEENPGATLEYGSHDEQNADQATSEVAMDNNPNLDDIDYQGFCEGEEESLRTTTYMPFGEGGTTATVTGWGQAMQITQYLGCGPSSLFCLDDKDMPEPYYTSSREEGLVSFSDERYALGVDCTFPDMNFRTRASWLHNKWPRLEFHGKDWRLEQQWAVKEGVVVEQIMFYNDKDTDMDFLHYNNFDFRIRELDFIEPACNFNKPSKRNFQGEEDEDEESEKNDCAIKGPGPGGFGFVQIQKFSSEDDNERYRKSEETSHPDSVAAIAGFLVNGKPLTYAQVTENKTHHVKAKSSHQMVVGYKLILLHSEDHNSNWKRLTLTVQDMDINEILRNENEEANAPQWDANLPPIVHAKASNAQDERIVEKSIKRAVENILSVCMIPVGDGYYWNISTDLRDCDLAMTCGDLSGHRVCPSASL
ncbi:pyridoxal-dependent decarboxylase domain protein [Penicillium angulare]|uniref:pyridoxal-dependent decarboxylase domain protein n=1 Tax=Penicillium angulare TaxID=116970 RepID=UPI002541761C|nr:pyridoxal-dependent decarboxylase domain protein [Penicillium angulare]KAJ5291327.1 pyridoxal-dependent decarboxylase domain protein [Penicillium angulare]